MFSLLHDYFGPFLAESQDENSSPFELGGSSHAKNTYISSGSWVERR